MKIKTGVYTKSLILATAAIIPLFLIPASRASDGGGLSKEINRLNYHLDELSGSNKTEMKYGKTLDKVMLLCESTAVGSVAAQQLSEKLVFVFENSFIMNSDYKQGIPITFFQKITSIFPHFFGPENTTLIQWLNNPSPPESWRNLKFREFVKKQLDTNQHDNIHPDVIGGTVHDKIIRWYFLSDIVDTVTNSTFEATIMNWCRNESLAHEMSIVLTAFDNIEDGYNTSIPDLNSIERTLLHRLHALPVENWIDANALLKKSHNNNNSELMPFLVKASKKTYQDLELRKNAKVIEVLSFLADSIGPKIVIKEWLGSEQQESNVKWFIWLHTAGLLQNIHGEDSQTMSWSFELLLRLVKAGHYPATQSLAHGYYYENLPDSVFTHLLQEYSNGKYSEIIMQDALNGSFSWRHREKLGLYVLGVSDKNPKIELNPADIVKPIWQGGPTRLKIACRLLSNLVTIPSDSPSFQTFVNSPLLKRIMSELLMFVRPNSKSLDQLIDYLEPIAKKISQLRKTESVNVKSKPIQEFESQLAITVLGELTSLREPTDDGHISIIVREHILRFVKLFELTMRINELITRATGDSPLWLGKVRKGIATKIFGLNSLNDQTVDSFKWEKNVLEFRARILLTLDKPLTRCLSDKNVEAEAWWKTIYLPIAKVPEMLKILRNFSAETDTKLPHLSWIRRDPINSSKLLIELFDAIHVKYWLDAEEPIEDLLTERLNHIGYSPKEIWELDPERLLDRDWDINTGLFVWKKFLDKYSPVENHDWKLPEITSRIISELGRSPDHLSLGNPRIWGYIPWLLNILTATEWQLYPFLSENNETLSTISRITPTGNSSKPFDLVTNGEEVSRIVDAKLRLQLLHDVILPQLQNASADEVEMFIRATIFLPNRSDNLDPLGKVTINDCNGIRQLAYEFALIFFKANDDFEEKFRWLENLMLISASARGKIPFEPNFLALLQNELHRFNEHSGEVMRIKELHNRFFEIKNLADNSSKKKQKGNRQKLKEKLDTLVPDMWLTNTQIHARDWDKRLKALDEEQVDDHLKLLRDFELYLSNNDDVQSKEGLLRNKEDLDLIQRTLVFIDYHVNYSRQNFDGRDLLGIVKPARLDRKKKGIQQEEFKSVEQNLTEPMWWPAISILTWITPSIKIAFEEEALGILNDSRDYSDQAIDVLRRLVLLNDAVFKTLESVMSNKDHRDTILGYEHHIEHRLYNFRLLAESITVRRTTADALSNNTFDGIAQNLEIYKSSGLRRSDELAKAQFFYDITAGISKQFKRNPFVIPGENHLSKSSVDALIRKAIIWQSDPECPRSVIGGARRFIDGISSQPYSLLKSVESPAGVTSILTEIFAQLRIAKFDVSDAKIKYFNFYEELLLSNESSLEIRISDGLSQILTETMFQTWKKPEYSDIISQKVHFEKLVRWWRSQIKSTAPQDPLWFKSFYSGFGNVLNQLIRGEDRGDNNIPYLWEPVDKLEKVLDFKNAELDKEGGQDKALRPPDKLLDLMDWFYSLSEHNDPNEMNILLGPVR